MTKVFTVKQVIKAREESAKEGQLQMLLYLQGYLEGLLSFNHLEDSDRVTMIMEKIKELQE